MINLRMTKVVKYLWRRVYICVCENKIEVGVCSNWEFDKIRVNICTPLKVTKRRQATFLQTLIWVSLHQLGYQHHHSLKIIYINILKWVADFCPTPSLPFLLILLSLSHFVSLSFIFKFSCHMSFQISLYATKQRHDRDLNILLSLSARYMQNTA